MFIVFSMVGYSLMRLFDPNKEVKLGSIEKKNPPWPGGVF
jgi:hypothetical protein